VGARRTESVVQVGIVVAVRMGMFVAVVVARPMSMVGVVVMVMPVDRAIGMTMLVRVWRVEVLAVMAMDVPVHRAVRADVLVNLTFDGHLAGAAAAGGAH